MRVTPLVVAIGIVVVLVVAGGITSGLILARGQTTPPVAEVTAPLPNSAAAPEPTLAPPPTTEPEGLAVPEPKAKTVPDTQAERFPEVSEGSKGSNPALEGAGTGKIYTWQDGDEERRVVLQPQQAPVDSGADAKIVGIADDGSSETDGSSQKEKPGSFEQKQVGTDDGQPVFRSESGGELMTLPGGIILALDPEWDESTVAHFFSDNGISLDRTTEIEFLDNGFFVETEPGFPSLELANKLAGEEGVVLSSPNWAREMELK